METFLSETPAAINHRLHAEFDLRQLISRRAVVEKFNSMVHDQEANFVLLRSLLTPRSPLPPYPIYENDVDYYKATDRLLGDALVAQRRLLRVFYLDSPTTLTFTYRLLISRRVFRSVVLEYQCKSCSEEPQASASSESQHHSSDVDVKDKFERKKSPPSLYSDIHTSILRSVFTNLRQCFQLLSQSDDENTDESHHNCFKIFEDLQEVILKLPKTDDEHIPRNFSSCQQSTASIDLCEDTITEMLTFIRECSVNSSLMLHSRNVRQKCLELWLLVTGLRGSLLDVLIWALSCQQAHHVEAVDVIRPNIVRKALSDFLHLNVERYGTDISFSSASETVLRIVELINYSLEQHCNARDRVTQTRTQSIRCFFGSYRHIMTELQSNHPILSTIIASAPVQMLLGSKEHNVGINVVAVEAAHEQTFFLSADGRVFYSPIADTNSASSAAISSRRLMEMRLEEPLGSRRPARRPHVVQISANIWDNAAFHVLALTSDGAVYASGCGEYGALGRGSANSEARFKPVLILGGGREAPFVVGVSAGGRHSAAVTRDGSLYIWGANQFGQLGFASQTVYVPMKVECLPPVRQVACSSHHTVLLCEDSSVWTLGCRRSLEAAAQMSLEARAVRRRVLLPQSSSSSSRNYRPVRVTAAGDLSLIRTEDERLLVEGLETRVGRIGSGDANALMTRLRGGANGPPIGNTREAVVMENFAQVRDVAASPNIILIVTTGCLVYQVDPNRFTNSRVRELDTALITHVSVSQSHFVAWSQKDIEPESGEKAEKAATAEACDANYPKNHLLSQRVLGAPFVALQQLSDYLRDFIQCNGVWTSGLDPRCKTGQRFLKELVIMFSWYLRLLDTPPHSITKEELKVAKIDWLTVLLDLYQEESLPKDIAEQIRQIVEDQAHHLCPPIEERCPLLYNMISDIRFNRLDGAFKDDKDRQGCWWTRLTASTALSFLLLLRGTATSESVVYMVREYTKHLEDLMEWSLDLYLSLSEWAIHNAENPGPQSSDVPEPIQLFSQFLHLAMKHTIAICVDVDDEARLNRSFRPNRAHFAALLSRQIQFLLRASVSALKATKTAVQAVLEDEEMQLSKQKEIVSKILACLKDSPVGQLLFFVVIGFIQAPNAWVHDMKKMAVGLKSLLEEMSALVDVLPPFVGAKLAERQELDWPLFARHGEAVQLWAVSLSRGGSESQFFWIFELQRLLGFALGRLLLWCLTEFVPSPSRYPEEKQSNWWDRGLISNGLSPMFCGNFAFNLDISERHSNSFKSVMYLFQKMDKSLHRLLNNDNYGKLMTYAKKKNWPFCHDESVPVSIATNCLLTLIINLTHHQPQVLSFDPINGKPSKSMESIFRTVFLIRRFILNANPTDEKVKKFDGVSYDPKWTKLGPWYMTAELSCVRQVLIRCILLDRVFEPNPLIGQLKTVSCEKQSSCPKRHLSVSSSCIFKNDDFQMKPLKRSKSLNPHEWKESVAMSSKSTMQSSLESMKRHFRRFDFNRRQSQLCSVDRLLNEIVSFLTNEKIFHVPEDERDDSIELETQEICALAREVLEHTQRAAARLACFSLFEDLVGGSCLEEDEEEPEDSSTDFRQISCNDIPWDSRLPHAVSLQIMAGFCGLDPLEEDYSRVPGLLNVEDVSAAMFDQRQELTVKTHCMVNTLLQRLSLTISHTHQQQGSRAIGHYRIEAFLLHALSLPYDQAMLEVVINGGLLDLLVLLDASPELLIQHKLRHGDPGNLRNGMRMMAWHVAEIVVLSASKIQLSAGPARTVSAFLAFYFARFLRTMSSESEWQQALSSSYESVNKDKEPTVMDCDSDVVGEALSRFLSLVMHLAFRSETCGLLSNQFWIEGLLFAIVHDSFDAVDEEKCSLAYPVRSQAAFLLRHLLSKEKWQEVGNPNVDELISKLLSTAGQLILSTDRFWHQYLVKGRQFLSVTEHLLKRENVAGAGVNQSADMVDFPPLFDPSRCEGSCLEDGGEVVRAMRKSLNVVGLNRMSLGLWEIRLEIQKVSSEGMSIGLCMSPDGGSPQMPPLSVVSYQTRTGTIVYPQGSLRGYHSPCSSGIVTLLLHADDCLFGMYVGHGDPKWSDTRLNGNSWNVMVQLNSDGDSVRLVYQRQLPPWRWSALHPAVPATELPGDPFLVADHLLDALSQFGTRHRSALQHLLARNLRPDRREKREDRRLQAGAFAFVSGLCNGPAPGYCTNFRLPRRQQEGWETLSGVLLGLYPRTVGLSHPRPGAWQCRVQRCPPQFGAGSPDGGARLAEEQREALEVGEWAANVLRCEPRTLCRPRDGRLVVGTSCEQAAGAALEQSAGFWTEALAAVMNFSALASQLNRNDSAPTEAFRELRPGGVLESKLDADIRTAREAEGLAGAEDEAPESVPEPSPEPPPSKKPDLKYADFLHSYLLMKSLILGLRCLLTGEESQQGEMPDLKALEPVMVEVANWALELMPVLRFREWNGLDNIDTAVLVLAQWAADAARSNDVDSLLDLWHDSTEILAYPLTSSREASSRRLTVRSDNSSYLELLLQRSSPGTQIVESGNRSGREFFGPLDAWIERARIAFRNQTASRPSSFSESSDSTQASSHRLAWPSNPGNSSTVSDAAVGREARLHRRCIDLNCDLLLDPRRNVSMHKWFVHPCAMPNVLNSSPEVAPCSIKPQRIVPSNRSSSQTYHRSNSTSDAENRLFTNIFYPALRHVSSGRVGLFRQLTKLRNVPEALPSDVLLRLFSYMRISLAREYMAKLLESLPRWTSEHQSFLIGAHGLCSAARFSRLLKLLQWDDLIAFPRPSAQPSPLDRWSQILQNWMAEQFRCGKQPMRLTLLIELRQTLKAELCRLQRCVDPAEVVCEQMVVGSGCYRSCELLMQTVEGLLERHFREAPPCHFCPQALDCPLCRLYHNLLDWLLRVGMGEGADQLLRSWMLTRVAELFSIRRRCGLAEAVKAGGLVAADVDNLLDANNFSNSLPVCSPVQRLFLSNNDRLAVAVDAVGRLHVWNVDCEPTWQPVQSVFSSPPAVRSFTSGDDAVDSHEICYGVGRVACSANCSMIATASGRFLNVWSTRSLPSSPLVVGTADGATVITALVWAEASRRNALGEPEAHLLFGRGDGTVRYFLFDCENHIVKASENVPSLCRSGDCVTAIAWPKVDGAVAVGFKSGHLLVLRAMRWRHEPAVLLYPSLLNGGLALGTDVACASIIDEWRTKRKVPTQRLVTFSRGAKVAGVYNLKNHDRTVVPLIATLDHKSPLTVAAWLKYAPLRASSQLEVGQQDFAADRTVPTMIATGCLDGSAFLWDVMSSGPICTLTSGHRSPITCVARADRHGCLVATGCTEGLLNIWLVSDLAVPVVLLTLNGQGAVSGIVMGHWSDRLAASWARESLIRVIHPARLRSLMRRDHLQRAVLCRRLTEEGLVSSRLVDHSCRALLLFGPNLLESLRRQYLHDLNAVARGKELRFSPVTTIMLTLVAALGLSATIDRGSERDRADFNWLARYEQTLSLAEAFKKRQPPVKDLPLPILCDGKEDWSWSREEDAALLTWFRERPEDWDLAADCQLFLWGSGTKGQLGLHCVSATTPLLLGKIRSVRQVFAGRRITYIVDAHGSLLAMGEGMSVRENQNTMGEAWDPIPVPHLSGLKVVQVVTPILPTNSDGFSHVLALTSHGDVYAWGDGSRGKLGLAHGESVRRPRIVEGVRGREVVRLAAGPNSSAAITASGLLWYWGAHETCPYHSYGADLLTPVFVSSTESCPIKDIALRSDSGLMVSAFDSSVLAFCSRTDKPQVIPSLYKCNIDRVFASENFSVAWSRSPLPGKVFTWGCQGFVGRADRYSDPLPVALPGEILDVSINADCCLALVRLPKQQKSALYAWGAGALCHLLPARDIKSLATGPEQITDFKEKFDVRRVSCGMNHAAVWTTPAMDLQSARWSRKTYGSWSLLQLPPLRAPRRDPPAALTARRPAAWLSRLRLLCHWTNLVESCWQLLPLEQPLISASTSLPLVGAFCSEFASGSGDLRQLLTRPIFEPILGRIIALTSHVSQWSSAQTMMKLARPRSGVEVPPVFAQMAYEALRMPVTHLRVSPGNVAWRVRLLGEAADDVGGVYEDMMSTACEELQEVSDKQALNLLVPIPNARSTAPADPDDNAEFLLQPMTVPPKNATAHFTALGIFLGLAVRSQKPLGLHLALLFWRRLAGLDVRASDLESIDTAYIRSIHSLSAEDAAAEGLSAENFAELIPEERFRAVSADGSVVTVGTDGEFRALNFESRRDYGRAVLEYRCQEDILSTSLVLDGLTRLLPMPLLRLFRPEELEEAVCGSAEVTVASLKAIVKYSGYVADDDVVQWLWGYLEQSSASQRARFLRFVSGRTRLPSNPSLVRQPFLVIRISNVDDGTLPSAQTCFFQLRLPTYSSREVLESRLSYAIQHCGSIDSDNYMLNRPDVQVMPVLPALPVIQPGAEADLPVGHQEPDGAAAADLGWEDLGDGDSDSSPSLMIED